LKGMETTDLIILEQFNTQYSNTVIIFYSAIIAILIDYQL